MCVCVCGFCNVWVCVCVGFVKCGCVWARARAHVCVVLKCVGVCMCGFCNVCVCVCLCGFCNCVCVYVCVCVCVYVWFCNVCV